MRILNIVLNAEIKYQQYAKLRKSRHNNFRSNFDPGKTHKGKTSERGRFLLFRSFREFCYSPGTPLGKRPAHTAEPQVKGSSDAVVISDAPTHTHMQRI
jgi:hypothetical protein